MTTIDAPYAVAHTSCHKQRTLCWGAILAGCFAALALQIVLMMLGAGLGFAMYHPLTNDNPVGDLGTGAVVVQGISAVLSLWVGGWVGGRFLGRNGLGQGRMHGFMVWSLSTVVAIAAVTLGAGWALGDLSKLVGGGLSAAGKAAAPAVSGATDMAKEAAGRSSDMVKSFLDESLSNRNDASNSTATIRAKRETGFALGHYLMSDSFSAGATEGRQEVVVALKNQGYSEGEANRMIDDWSASYLKLKAEINAAKAKAEQKAREVAEEAAKTLALFSLCAFAAFVIGAASAIMGGKHGGWCAFKRSDEVAVITPLN